MGRGETVFVKLKRDHVFQSGEASITKAECGGPETKNLAICSSSNVILSIFSGAFV